MKSILDFEKYLHKVQLTPKHVAEMNSLIFYNWNERDGKKYFPDHVVRLISSIQNDDLLLNQVYDCLIGYFRGKEGALKEETAGKI